MWATAAAIKHKFRCEKTVTTSDDRADRRAGSLFLADDEDDGTVLFRAPRSSRHRPQVSAPVPLVAPGSARAAIYSTVTDLNPSADEAAGAVSASAVIARA
ncbi:MAG: hypothetical protein KDK75_07975, partial [Alphaproteobacteria bacterium]|nr:hypothetical protein [Alphaproteobacteria bacterium]